MKMRQAMDMSKLARSILATIAGAVLATTAAAQNFEPQYIGGYPTEDTAQAAFDEYDYQAATQFYVWGYVYLNSLGLEKGFAALGGDERSIYIFDQRLQPQHKVMTGNAEVVYTFSRFVDLSKGPVVYEVPPRSRGHFFGFGQRAYMDSGDVGPDKGKGGKYLIVDADYSGELPEGYFVVRVLHSDRIGYVVRTFPEAEGSLEKAVDLARQLRWYYLDEAADPSRNEIVLVGDRPYSQEWPRDEQAFEWLAEAVNMDRIPAPGLPHLGNMRRLGIVKGEPFAPDARAREILKRAARSGEAMVLSMAYRNRVGMPIYDDRQFEPYANNKSPTFLQPHYEEVEERAGAWHQIASNFATYTPAKAGTGQFSMTTYRDADGHSLIGSNLYRLRVPADVPVKQFWQIPVYEVATRALIATDQGRSSLSDRDELRLNSDGSVDLYFGPEAPEGFEQNWIKTKPGEGWFSLLRLYAPEQPILDKTWRWNDFEKVK